MGIVRRPRWLLAAGLGALALLPPATASTGLPSLPPTDVLVQSRLQDVAPTLEQAQAETTSAAEETIRERWAPDPDAWETVIGYSRGGRPLLVHHLGWGEGPILVLGGQHGAPEANTVRLAWQLISHFERNSDEIPARLRLDVLPEANPDGLTLGSRQFATGVDPNRNWGGPDWGPDASDSNGQFRRGLGGPEPFSEPETQSLRDYVLATRPLLTVNYHSRGGFLFGGRLNRGNQLADAYSAASGYYRPQPGAGGTSAGSVLGYRASGSMNVWLAEQSMPGLLIELATSHDSEFERNLAGIRAALAVLGGD